MKFNSDGSIIFNSRFEEEVEEVNSFSSKSIFLNLPGDAVLTPVKKDDCNLQEANK